MEEGNSSEDEIIVPELYSLTEDIETQVIRTLFFFFWLEKTYTNNKGIGQWQHGQLINLKLWQITNFIHLAPVKQGFPEIVGTSVTLVLDSAATVHLDPFVELRGSNREVMIL